ncbi:MAG: hypothetical protein QOC96_2010 [Acidobacteriota bacterium]|jgi:hypothetical protein|nr:hypothetical protein [Acidobacteriota bacterium]
MANDNPVKTTLEEKNADPELKPDATPNATEELNPANDQRTLDIGESGQFAPGGYYNQHGVVESERLDLDEYTATRTPDKK